MPTFTQDVQEIRRRAAQKIEEGPVTQGYKGDVEQTIDILNQALATEIVCVLRYMHHYFMATGVHGTAVRDEFKEHADNEREHADAIAERIQQLGGKPDYNPRTLLERSASQYVEGETLADMIREDLIAERIVIEIYQDMIRHFGNDDPTTRRMIEKILTDEEDHASDLTDLLYIVEPSTGKTEGEDPGADPLKLGKAEGKAGNSQGRNTVDGSKNNKGGEQRQQVSNQNEKRASGGDANSRTSQKDNRGRESAAGRDASSKRGEERGTKRESFDADSSVPQSAGRGQRNRGLAGPADAEGGELHSGQQLGASRAVRQTQPNRKRRVA